MQPQAKSQAQAGQGGAYVANYHRSDVQIYSNFSLPSRREVLDQTAVQYVTGTTGHEPGKLPHNVDGCYSIALGAVDRQDSIQRCMILDYTAYKEILEGRHHPTIPEKQYFSQATAGARRARYGPAAGFTDPDRMFDYLRKAYAYVRDRAEFVRNDVAPAFHISPRVPP